MLFKDQLNRKIYLQDTPQRIISLVPSQTELLCDLGLENELVGVTKFCVHPSSIRKNKTIVGGTKNIKIDVIHALNPDIILCNKEENTQEIVALCQQIAPVHIADIFTINDTLELIKQYGELFNKKVEALKMVEELNSKHNDFLAFIQNKPQKRVAYFIWRNPWMVAGNNTFINHLLTLNKFINSYATKNRYPEVVIEKIGLESPEFIFLSSEPYPFKKEHITELEKFASNTKIIFVDGEFFSWYGSRLLKAFDYFKKLHQRII